MDRRKKNMLVISITLVITAIIILASFAVAKYVLKNTQNVDVVLKNAKIAETEIKLSTEDWTNGKVSVSISTNKKGEIYYKVNENGEWIKYDKSFDVEENCDIYAKLKYTDGEGPETVKKVQNIDKTAPKVMVTKSNYKTFIWNATESTSGVAGYAITTTSTQPTSFTTGATATGTKEITAAGTYYVWVKDKAGNVGNASISAYTLKRIQGTGSTLTTRVDSTSSDKGTAVTSDIAVLKGTTVWASATANTGYNTPVLKNGTIDLKADGDTVTVNEDTTISSSASVNYYTLTYDYSENGGKTVTKTTESVAYNSNVDLTPVATKAGWNHVGWNTDKDATTALTSYKMPASDKTIYAIYNKEIKGSFNYYNSANISSPLTQNVSVTIYNKATKTNITAPAGLGTPSGYTFRHWSKANIANAEKTVGAGESITITADTTNNPQTQDYYASYNKTVTATFYYSAGASDSTQKNTTAVGVQYLAYNGTKVESTIAVPTVVTGSTGYRGTTYKGVSTTKSSTTAVTPTTATTTYYAYYQSGITYYYYNGTAHTSSSATRTSTTDGTTYSSAVNTTPTPSAYDGAAFKAWSSSASTVSAVTPNATTVTSLYAYYQKSVTGTFNYYDGTKAASATTSATRTYISKSGGVNTINANYTVPAAVSTSRTIGGVTYTYRGLSTANGANATIATPTTANATFYASYTYPIKVTFDGNGATGTAPTTLSGTGYMNYAGTKVGASLKMPANTFVNTGYKFESWSETKGATSGKYVVGTSYTFTANATLYAVWTKYNYLNTTTNVYYMTLAEAMNAAKDKETVKLLQARTENTAATVASGKSVTFDLNGQTLIMSNVSLTNNGTLTISGTSGKITGSGANTIVNAGTLVKNTAAEIANSSSSTYSAISNSGTATISAGKVTGSNVAITSTAGTVTITGGTITGTAKAVSVTGSSSTVTLGTNDGNISITSPAITASTGIGVDVGSGATFNFYDGVIKGATGKSINGSVTATAPTGLLTKTTANNIETAILGPSAVKISAKLDNANGSAYTSGVWTNHNVYVTLSCDKVGNGIKEYQLSEDGGTTWKTATANNETLTTANNVGTITFTADINKEVQFRAIDNNNLVATTGKITIKIDKTKPTVSITRSNYKTFAWNAKEALSGIAGYAITTTSTTPTLFTTGATATGTKEITAAGTYYVWVKDNAGNIGSASISAYTVTRSQGTGSTLKTRVDSTGSDNGTEVNSNTVVLKGTTLWASATANTGYNTPVLKNGSTALTATGATVTVNGNVTISSSATINTYTVTYDYKTNGGTTATKETATVAYGSAIDLTPTATKAGWTFVGWNTSSTATTKLSSLKMGTNNVTLYAIYSKTIKGTFKYSTDTTKDIAVSETIYNTATKATLKAPATTAIVVPSGYTFRHWSTSNAANASSTVVAGESITITADATNNPQTQDYYASYNKTVTATFYYSAGASDSAQKSTTAVGTQYLAYNGTKVESTISVPTAVTGSTGYRGTTYKGVSASKSSTTAVTPTTATTTYYAYYQTGITYYHYNGTAHTSTSATRSLTTDGTTYSSAVNTTPTPSAYDGAAFKGWSSSASAVSAVTPSATTVTSLYAYYQKAVTGTFNYYDGSKQTTATASATRTYISKSGGVNTVNANYTVPTAVTGSKGSKGEAYKGVSTAKSSTTAATSITTATTTYYAYYQTGITYYYYNGTAHTSTSATRTSTTDGTTYSSAVNTTPTPSAYDGASFKGWSSSESAVSVVTPSATTVTSLYAYYQKAVTGTFNYYDGSKQTTATASATRTYISKSGGVNTINANYTVPTAVTGSKGSKGETYKGVSTAKSSTTAATSITTATTTYYAYYQIGITYYYYNGTAHTSSSATRTSTTDGTTYSSAVNTTPSPSAYDGATFKAWSSSASAVSAVTPNATTATSLYAYYQKAITGTFNYYDGTKAASATTSATRTYISKSGGVNTINANYTVPTEVSTSRTIGGVTYTYRGVSTANGANATIVTPTTANATFYASYTYPIKVTFDGNGATGTAPTALSGTGYMNYAGTKVGASLKMPANTFVKTGYKFENWSETKDATSGKYVVGTSYTFTANATLYPAWTIYNYKNTTKSTYFMTLPEALNAAVTGDTIQVIRGRTENTAATVASGKTVTLDLNGQTVIMSNVELTNNGTLTITGASGALTSATGRVVTNNGTFTKSGNCKIEGSSTIGSTIVNNGTATITAGTVSSTNYNAIYNGDTSTTAKLTVSGGTIKSKEKGIVNKAKGTVTVTNGTITSTGQAVYNETEGTINISGGAITSTGANTIVNGENATGTITISGGTIDNTATDSAGRPCLINYNGNVVIKGNAKINSAFARTVLQYKANGTIDIQGGTITNSSTTQNTSCYAVGAEAGTVKISGGTITSKIANAVRIGAATVTISGGTLSTSNGDAIYCGDANSNLNVSGGTITTTTSAGISIGNGTVTVTGGKVTGKSYGIWTSENNKPKVTIGANDGKISVTSPEITATAGTGVSIGSGVTLNFYDGVIKGATEKSITGTVTSVATNCVIVKTTSGSTETAVLGPSVPVITAKLDNSSGASYTSGAWTNHNVWVQLKSASVGAEVKNYQWSEDGGTTWKTDYLTTSSNTGTITFTADRNKEICFRAVDNNNVVSTVSKYIIRKDTVVPTVTINRTSTNTFEWKSSDALSGVAGYAITTSSSTPTSWTTSGTLTSGTKTISAAGTYYVWIKDKSGNINKTSIAAYTMTRSQGTGSTLTTRLDGTSASTGTPVTSNTVVLSGTPVWAVATANTGYNTPVLKNGSTTITASGTKVIITANTTISSSATANTPTITYDNNYLTNDLYTNSVLVNSYATSTTTTKEKTTTDDSSAKYGKVVQLTMNEGTRGGPYFGASRLTVGTTYTWSVYVKASREISLTVGQEQGGKKNVKVTTNWQRITNTFTATDYTYNAFVFYTTSGGWNDGDILYVHSLELSQVGKLNTSTATKTYGNTLASLPAPTRTGYTFAGWYTAPTGGTKIETTTAVPASNTTYYAHWTVNKYYLDLNGNCDGSSTSGINGYGTANVVINGVTDETGATDYYKQWPYGTQYTINSITATTGHTYNGVASGSASGTITAATTVSLKFTTNKYNLTFQNVYNTFEVKILSSAGALKKTVNVSSSSPTISDILYTDIIETSTTGVKQTLSGTAFTEVKCSNAPTRTGYTWNSSVRYTMGAENTNAYRWDGTKWYTDHNGDTACTAFSRLASTNGYTAKLTIGWTINNYTVTYDKNFLSSDLYTNATNLSYYKAATTGPSESKIAANGIAKDGRELQFTMKAGAGGPYYSGLSLTSGTKYTWSCYIKASRAIKLTSMGQEQGGKKAVDVTTDWQRITCTYTASSATNKAFVFYTSSSDPWKAGDVLYIHSLELMQTDSLNTSSVSKKYGDKLGTLSTPTRTGYTFLGWYTSPTGGSQISSSTTVPSKNVTYYANWQVNIYQNTTSKNTYFALNKAFAEANTNETIEMLRDNAEEIDQPIVPSMKSLKLELSNKTLTLGHSGILNQGTLYINQVDESDGSENSKGGTINHTGTYPAIQSEGSMLYVGPCSINAPNARGIVIESTESEATISATARFYGTKVTAGQNGLVYNSSYRSSAIKCSFKATNASSGVYIKAGIFNFSKNTITGDYGVFNQGATVELVNGTTVTGESKAGVVNWQGYSGTTKVGLETETYSTSGVIVTGKTYGVENASGVVYFNNGTIKGESGAISGTYSVRSGYSAVSTTSGSYKVLTLKAASSDPAGNMPSLSSLAPMSGAKAVNIGVNENVTNDEIEESDTNESNSEENTIEESTSQNEANNITIDEEKLKEYTENQIKNAKKNEEKYKIDDLYVRYEGKKYSDNPEDIQKKNKELDLNVATLWKDTTNTKEDAIVYNGKWLENYLELDGKTTYAVLNNIQSDTITLEATIELPKETEEKTEQEEQLIIGNEKVEIYITKDKKVVGKLHIKDKEYTVTSTIKIEPEKVYGIALTYDGENIRLYVNDKEEQTTEVKGSKKETKEDSLMSVGAKYTEDEEGKEVITNYFEGKIYSVAIYKKALSKDDVVNNYNYNINYFKSKEQ